jgi:hypothetical protein
MTFTVLDYCRSKMGWSHSSEKPPHLPTAKQLSPIRYLHFQDRFNSILLLLSKGRVVLFVPRLLSPTSLHISVASFHVNPQQGVAVFSC